MAESTIHKTKIDGTWSFAALGGGAYNTSTGALIVSSDEYTLSFEQGDASITLPSRGVQNQKDRGRITSPPSIRYTDDVEGAISMSLPFRDMSDAAANTLMDIMSTLSGNPSGYVGSNWESTLASAAGAGDAEVFAIAGKLTITNAGDGTDTHVIAFNYLTGTVSLAEGDPDMLTVSLVINDPVDDYYIA